MDRLNNRLPMGNDIVDVLIEIKNPSERLLRRCDVVSPGTEYEDRRADIAQVDRGSVGGEDPACRKIVTDEEFVDNELYFLCVESNVTSPPSLEVEIALGFGVDLRVEIVL